MSTEFHVQSLKYSISYITKVDLFNAALKSVKITIQLSIKMDSNSFNEVKLKIDGMTCMSCVKNIESHIIKLDGIQSVTVDLKGSSGLFVFDSSSIAIDEIIENVEDMGFDAKVWSSSDNSNKISTSVQKSEVVEIEFPDSEPLTGEGQVTLRVR
jgi:copper chaperone CopZ